MRVDFALLISLISSIRVISSGFSFVSPSIRDLLALTSLTVRVRSCRSIGLGTTLIPAAETLSATSSAISLRQRSIIPAEVSSAAVSASS